uniref:FeS assembly protein n=1 Tax=Voromonas pontica TaxID=333133 RepID=A0A059T310_9ALVE|nr:FeS assembly protein [Voromonas pontica]
MAFTRTSSCLVICLLYYSHAIRWTSQPSLLSSRQQESRRRGTTDGESSEFSAGSKPYPYGFTTTIETETFPPGLDEGVIRRLSTKKNEPEWLLEFRLKAYRAWQGMEAPDWSSLSLPTINYQNISYYSAPKNLPKKGSLDEVDPALLATFEKLGIPLSEQKRLTNVAVDAVFDSVSLGTTFHAALVDAGVIFCSISEAVERFPHLVRQYLGSVVPPRDNFFAALNSAVFSDGTFVFIPPGVHCPMELSTYFRINAEESGQFERTLVVASADSECSYLEGCTAPAFSSSQLHAAVVELVLLDGATLKYSTVQNWYAGDPRTGEGGVLNLVTKRGRLKGAGSQLTWTQVEAGAAATWKYPSCVLEGADTTCEFYSVALTNGRMQADTGTKMVHLGPRSRSRVVSKGIAADRSLNTYRGLIEVGPRAVGARSFSQCDSLLIGGAARALTLPTLRTVRPRRRGRRGTGGASVASKAAQADEEEDDEVDGAGLLMIEHEATTSRVRTEALGYLRSRGLDEQAAIALLTAGFAEDVLTHLPMEFAVEADRLLALKLEGAVG